MAGVGILAGVLLPAAAQAATFVVNSTADVVDAAPGNGVCATAAGVCTLRAAIQEANTLAGGPHAIVLPAGTYTLTIPGRDEDAAATGDLDITASMTISGSGAATTIIDANAIDRIFQVMAGAVVTISGITITRGDVHDGGGGILNAGTLTLNDSIVYGNTAFFVGGIGNIGTLILNNSTVSSNVASNDVGGIRSTVGILTLNNSSVSGNKGGPAGGILSGAGATVTLTNSTVSGNSAGIVAGGIYYSCATGGGTFIAILTLTNSTVSGNSAATYGGGILIASDHVSGCSGAKITLNNSTVTANRAGGAGGGIMSDPRNNNVATITLKNSIVAANTGSTGANCNGTMTSLGHNIVGDASCALAGVGDRNGVDPLLGRLANNGGPTQTHAPLAGSPAIDAVPLADCTDASGAPIATDQRGVARPQGVACDIGSVDAKPQLWMLVLGLAGAHGDSIATAPKLFAAQVDCRTAGQAWLDKVVTVPNTLDLWDARWPAKFLCFQVATN